MSAARPIITGRAGWGSTVLLVTAAAVGIALALSSGCSADRRYRVMSFFFDGVPNPHAAPTVAGAGATTGGGTGSAATAGGLVAYEHKPYIENKCNACHSGNLGGFESFQKVGSDVCLKCHQNELTKFTVMHGPVVAVECLRCHAPHESSVPGMLNDNVTAVCTQCHVRGLLSSNPPDHLLPNSACLRCHTGHGGPRHNMLRADATIPALRIPPPEPANRPAAAGSAASTPENPAGGGGA